MTPIYCMAGAQKQLLGKLYDRPQQRFGRLFTLLVKARLPGPLSGLTLSFQDKDPLQEAR